MCGFFLRFFFHFLYLLFFIEERKSYKSYQQNKASNDGSKTITQYFRLKRYRNVTKFLNNCPRFTAMNETPTVSPLQIQYSMKKKLPSLEPRVDVIVIDSRGRSNPYWVKRCLDSIKNNTYGNIGLITVNNIRLKNSIGQCWNAAVERSTAKYVMFVGDDDMISNTLIHDLINGLHLARQANADVAAISCNMTMMDESAKTLGRMENPFTGLFIRDTLYNNPFNESLKNNVDTELIDRYRAQGMHFAIIQHNFGYYYRRHKGMVSGEDRFTTPLPTADE